MTSGEEGRSVPEEQQHFDDFVQRNLEWALDYVRRRLRPELRGDADSIDFVQEAVMSLVSRGAPTIPDDDEFRALLSRVLENDLRDRHRYVHRERRDVRRLIGPLSDTVLRMDPPAHTVTSPTSSVDRDEREAWIRLAMELLAPEDREVLRMREWDELTFEQIGERVGIAPDAARMRYHRALPKLARKVAALRLRPHQPPTTD